MLSEEDNHVPGTALVFFSILGILQHWSLPKRTSMSSLMLHIHHPRFYVHEPLTVDRLTVRFEILATIHRATGGLWEGVPGCQVWIPNKMAQTPLLSTSPNVSSYSTATTMMR